MLLGDTTTMLILLVNVSYLHLLLMTHSIIVKTVR